MKTSQIKLKQQKRDVKISPGHATITQQTAPPWIRSSKAFPQIQAALSLEVCSHARRRSKAKPPKRGVGAVTLELQVPELPQHSWCGSIGPSFMTVLRVMGVGWISYGKFFMFTCFLVGSSCWLVPLVLIQDALCPLFCPESWLVHSWLGSFRTSTLGPTTWKLEAFRVFQVMLSLGQMLRVSWNLEIGTLCYTCCMRDNKVKKIHLHTFDNINIPSKLHCTDYMLHS